MSRCYHWISLIVCIRIVSRCYSQNKIEGFVHLSCWYTCSYRMYKFLTVIVSPLFLSMLRLQIWMLQRRSLVSMMGMEVSWCHLLLPAGILRIQGRISDVSLWKLNVASNFQLVNMLQIGIIWASFLYVARIYSPTHLKMSSNFSFLLSEFRIKKQLNNIVRISKRNSNWILLILDCVVDHICL